MQELISMPNLNVDNLGRPTPQYLSEDGAQFENARGQGGAMNVRVVSDVSSEARVTLNPDEHNYVVPVVAAQTKLQLTQQGVPKLETRTITDGKIELDNRYYSKLLVVFNRNAGSVRLIGGGATSDLYTASNALYITLGTENPLLVGQSTLSVVDATSATLHWFW